MTVEKLITDHIDIWSSALQTRSTAGRGSNGKIDLYGIKKLRELILELAVRGKLVPQDPNDEPASELLKCIAAEKAELVKQGKIKKQKPLPEISEDEKPFELPEGWEWVRLGAIAHIFNGNSISSSEKENKYSTAEGIPFIATKDVGYGFEDLDYENGIAIPYGTGNFKVAAKGAVLICAEGGSAGKKCGITTQDICFGNKLFANECYHGVEPIYILANFLSPSFFLKFESFMTGIIGGISTSKFNELLIPLASSSEQKRINYRVTELMSLCDHLEQQSLTSLDAHQQLVETLLATLNNSQNAEELAENWARISQHFDTLFTTEASIDALKQTILQLAVMGKLVPQDPNDEPASELLKHIEQEKAQLVKEGKIKKHPPVEPLGEPALLPRSWLNIVVQDFADIRLGSTPDRSEKKYWNGDIPWVSSGEVANEVILDTKEKITSEGFKNSSTSMIPTGSLLMAIIGQGKTRGQTAILGIDACTNQNVAAFVFNQVFVEPEYVWIWAKSKYLSHRGDGHGGAQPALNGKKVRSFIFPLAPIKEQRRIVSEVKRFNDICDTLKSRLQSAQQTQLYLADALTDAALN
ncbi:restriction endonuclease subunit S [Raoultella ornithinolytica]|uniref:restriction endonuclease subunit S n=1 Tax=Raoultella ornithinolytica TaxID=54291 RepID=UPI00255AA82D|nr:restriction endonuclease subunit S [Raoultella ornithinolytica]EKV6727597.1 restriction endonuclease subunit S [Raoultella ornithinolytica]MDL4581340.1 restriction endonuclease subunit S [Raoultella ornithinolytica]MEB6439801.1 restriction endonuclease subunit S [Raoultella ornithinolytica]HDX8332939.1 restriction endonuclease subunit S [Raoultella ornithinolytica CD1_MRS_4]